MFAGIVACTFPAPLLAVVSTLIVPCGAIFLPTLKNQVDRNASDCAAGVGVGDGEGDALGVGEGLGVVPGEGEVIGVGLGAGCILLPLDPHPASMNNKDPEKKTRIAVRMKYLVGIWNLPERGTDWRGSVT